MFKNLDPLLHSQLRLAIISLLVGVESANFNYLLDNTGASKGNLSVQIKKLKEAGYIEVDKHFKDNMPETTCKITQKGVKAFEQYVSDISYYLNKQKGND